MKRKLKAEDNFKVKRVKRNIELPIEIIERIIQIFFEENLNHKCNQGHKWCFNKYDNHSYRPDNITMLNNVCRTWTNIVFEILYPYIWESIELNRKLIYSEQERTVNFVKFFINDNFFAKRYIKKIHIHHNFLTNIILNFIVKNNPQIDIVINSGFKKYTLNQLNYRFNSLLIQFYKCYTSDTVPLCKKCENEPIYPSFNYDKYHGKYCVKCINFKKNILKQNIVNQVMLLDKIFSISIKDL